MIQAFETLRKIGGRVGPKKFGTSWAEYALDYKEVVVRARAGYGEVEMMEEAIAWPGVHLAGETLARRLARDAVGFYCYHKASGHDLEPLIRERYLAALRRATEAANAENARMQARRSEIVADGQRWYAEQLSKREKNWAPSERAEKIRWLEHQRGGRVQDELDKLVPVVPRAKDGANGVCITMAALRDFRKAGFDIIAKALHRDQVPVR